MKKRLQSKLVFASIWRFTVLLLTGWSITVSASPEVAKSDTNINTKISDAKEASEANQPKELYVELLPEKAQVLDVKNKQIKGESYTFLKYRPESKTRPASLILESNGVIFDEGDLPKPERNPVGTNLQQVLDDPGSMLNKDAKARVKVSISLKFADDIDVELPPQTIRVVTGDDGKPVTYIDGEIADENDLALVEQQTAAAIATFREKRHQQREEIIADLVAKNGWETNSEFSKALQTNKDTLTLSLTKAEIQSLLENSSHRINGIDRHIEGTTALSEAMISTNVDPYAFNSVSTQGGGIGIYYTEQACVDGNNPSEPIPNYTELEPSNYRTDHTENVFGILRGVSPNSYIYCRGTDLNSEYIPSDADLLGVVGEPRVYIASLSAGSAIGDDEYRVAAADWDDFVYYENISAFLAAGNENGSQPGNTQANGGYLRAQARALNVVTVGNYNDANDTIYSTSSWINSEIGNEKPEISAPGTNITAGGYTMTGTSMATPHVAGFAANLMSEYSALRLNPALTKALILASATKAINGGVAKVGVGGLDFEDALDNILLTSWQGGNSSYNPYANYHDSIPNNNELDTQIYLYSGYSNVRVAVAWLTRGRYTRQHRNDAHPIGQDFDLYVSDPMGNEIASSTSWDNPFEVVEFDPDKTGYYTISIHRYSNRDRNNSLRLGLAVNATD